MTNLIKDLNKNDDRGQQDSLEPKGESVYGADGPQKVQNPVGGTIVTGNVTNDEFHNPGDKSGESLHAEASGADGTHPLSNLTPSKQDDVKKLEEERATGKVSDRDYQKRMGILVATSQEFHSTEQNQSDFAPQAPKLPIERFIEPGNKVEEERSSHTTSNSFIMKKSDEVQYKKLLKDVENSRGDRQLGDIPLSDEYWVKQNSLTLFLSHLKT